MPYRFKDNDRDFSLWIPNQLHDRPTVQFHLEQQKTDEQGSCYGHNTNHLHAPHRLTRRNPTSQANTPKRIGWWTVWSWLIVAHFRAHVHIFLHCPTSAWPHFAIGQRLKTKSLLSHVGRNPSLTRTIPQQEDAERLMNQSLIYENEEIPINLLSLINDQI